MPCPVNVAHPSQIFEVSELEPERWAHYFHAVVGPELLHDDLLVRYDSLSELRHLLEEIFHTAGGLKENEHLPFTFTHHGKRMRDVPRRKRRVTGIQGEVGISHLRNEPAADHIKPFVLKEVSMKRRAALGIANGVVNAKVTARVPARDL